MSQLFRQLLEERPTLSGLWLEEMARDKVADFVEGVSGLEPADVRLTDAVVLLTKEVVPEPRYSDLLGQAAELLVSGSHGFRSYQYGNSATDLAEEMADSIDTFLRLLAAAKLASGAPQPKEPRE